MSRFYSLVKAVFSQDMNILRYRKKPGTSRLGNATITIALIAVIMGGIGYYAYMMTRTLVGFGIAELLPIFFVIAFSIVSLFEGIFKVQSLLFECSDDNLLFSLPIPKSQIFLLRIGKFITFQVAFNALFMIPAFAAYALIVHPGATFYIFSCLMLILVPLIPTAIAIIAGYLVRGLSLRLRFRKFFQIVFSFIALAAIIAIMMNANSLVEAFAANAGDIAAFASQIYYPAGAYARLITEFNPADLLGLLAFCILPLAVVVYLCSRRYFHLISLARSTPTAKHRHVEFSAQSRSATGSLVRREISRYFSSPVFVTNTLVGVVLLFIGVILGAINLDNLGAFFGASGEEFSFDELLTALPTIYICTLVFMLTMTSITSSAISIEGKSFNLTKSLPVSPLRILLSKLLASLVITLPVIILCDLIFVVRFAPGPLDILAIFAFSILVPIFSGLVGLLVNLKYPKMTAASDAEVVKQSASAMISVLIGMFTSITTIIILSIFSRSFPVALIVALVFALIDFILTRVLMVWGVKKFRALTV